MEPIDRLIDLERRFWTGDAEFYRRELADGCLMLFPGVGVLTRDAAIEGIAGSRRWQSVEIAEPRLTELAKGAAILSYRASARREGDDAPYAALVSSAYVETDGGWKLAFHHQSPIA